jgi:hypothetical protein
MFGITCVGFYKPGSRLPLRFRRVDTISASQYFPLLGGLIRHSPMSKSLVGGSKVWNLPRLLSQVLKLVIDLFAERSARFFQAVAIVYMLLYRAGHFVEEAGRADRFPALDIQKHAVSLVRRDG